MPKKKSKEVFLFKVTKDNIEEVAKKLFQQLTKDLKKEGKIKKLNRGVFAD